MERLMPRLPEPIFTVDFIPQEGGNIAQLEFGYINKKKANGNMNTAPVNNASGSWLVEDIAFMIGDPGSGSFIPLNRSMIFGPSHPPSQPQILSTLNLTYINPRYGRIQSNQRRPPHPRNILQHCSRLRPRQR